MVKFVSEGLKDDVFKKGLFTFLRHFHLRWYYGVLFWEIETAGKYKDTINFLCYNEVIVL